MSSYPIQHVSRWLPAEAADADRLEESQISSPDPSMLCKFSGLKTVVYKGQSRFVVTRSGMKKHRR